MPTNENNLLKKELNTNKELNNPNHFILYDPQFEHEVLRAPRQNSSFKTLNARNKIRRRSQFRHRLTSRNGANIHGPSGRPPPLPKPNVSARRKSPLIVNHSKEAVINVPYPTPISSSSERRKRMEQRRDTRPKQIETTKPTILTREEYNKEAARIKETRAIKKLEKYLKNPRGEWR